MTDQMQVAVTAVKDTNFGDHGEFVRTAHLYDPDERVEDLVLRLLKQPYATIGAHDRVELQVVVDTQPEPTGASF